MDHMTKIIMPRIPHYIADALEMRGDSEGASTARNKTDLVDRFIEVRHGCSALSLQPAVGCYTCVCVWLLNVRCVCNPTQVLRVEEKHLTEEERKKCHELETACVTAIVAFPIPRASHFYLVCLCPGIEYATLL